MSFRSRLTLFFVLIVIVPMVSVAFVLFSLIEDSENGKAEARVAARQDAVIGLYNETRMRAGRTAQRVGRDVGIAAALRAGNSAAAERRAKALIGEGGIRRILIRRENGRVFLDAGSRDAVFPVTRELTNATGTRVFGTLHLSVQGAGRFARLARQIGGLDTAVLDDGRILASTLKGVEPEDVPSSRGKTKVGGEEYRAASFPASGFDGERLRVAVFDSTEQSSSDIRGARIFAAGVLAAFFILAFACAILVSRTLQRQIEGFLLAARRLGGGDFSAEVPTTGRDEFAALGQEFNKMSEQLEMRLEELREERGRLQRSMQRIGETFASNLDRDALLEIVVRTAVEGVGAEGGRATGRTNGSEGLEPVARVGALSGIDEALRGAETAVLASGAPAAADIGDVHALAHPLRGDGKTIQGTVAVGREGHPFSASERELFHYLAGQASVSIENVGLHETVERQAVTDELTGLFNWRRFQEVIQTEVERAKRFGQQLGLVMLDIDDFKVVNDTYGHPQGDVVLREVGRVLRESAREIDEPARYGGEELAVVLPGTDLEGAHSLAERVRAGIEALEIPQLADDPDGEPLRVTASFGVATLPGSADDVRGLIEAADEALYEAKRTGKNKVVRAG